MNLYSLGGASNPTPTAMTYGSILEDDSGVLYKVGAVQPAPKPNPTPWISVYEISKSYESQVEAISPKKSCVLTIGRTTEPASAAEYVGLNSLGQKVYRPTYFNIDTTNDKLYLIPKLTLPNDYSVNTATSYSVVENNEAHYLPNTVAFELINALKPFDHKTYTYLLNQSSFTMDIEIEKADTLALVGIRCDSINVKVFDNTNTQVGNTITKQIDNSVSNKTIDLVDYQTTSIVYFDDIIINGRVEVH